MAPTGDCLSSSILALWDYDIDKIPETSEGILQLLNDPPLITTFDTSLSIDNSLGSITRDDAGDIIGAQSFQVFYPTDGSDMNSLEQFELRYINAMLKLRKGDTFKEAAKKGGVLDAEPFAEASLQHLRIELSASRSFSDESDRQISKDTPLVAGAVILMIVYVSIVLGGKPCRYSRIGLTLMAITTIGLSLLCGFGIGAYFGNPFNVMSQLAIFIVMGIGIGKHLKVSFFYNSPYFTRLVDCPCYR